jgi:hypothetical protein
MKSFGFGKHVGRLSTRINYRADGIFITFFKFVFSAVYLMTLSVMQTI